MNVESVDAAALKLDPRNARVHPDRNLDAIRSSLRTYGQVVPILVRRETGVVIGGNGTLQALRELNVPEVKVVYVDGLSDEQVTDLALRLNRSAELAEWDEQQLATLLGELESFQLDLGELGWNEDEMKALRDAIAEDEEKDEGTANGDQGGITAEYVDFSAPMTVANRALVYDILRAAKAKYGVVTNSDAIIAILTEWRKQQEAT